MANKKNELAVVDAAAAQIIPTSEDIAAVMEELNDIERIPYGRISVLSGGANVFKVLEPGDENTTAASEIVGVILFSHKCNVYWATKFGEKTDGPKTPACSSLDGVTGIVAETGEARACDTCPLNQFGSAENMRGKACRNMRRLYIMREGDVFPIILSLPATSLKAYDYYRTRLAVRKKVPASVITQITLRAVPGPEKNQPYSIAVFEVIGALPKEEFERVKAYAVQFEKVAKSVGIDGDDDVSNAEPFTPSRPAPINSRNGEFVEIDPDEYDPFAVPVGNPPPAEDDF